MPAGDVALARHFWLDMPKVARLVPADADVVNAHEWLALRPGRIAAGRIAAPLVWTRNDESLWERAIVPKQTITGERSPLRRVLQGALTWPDLLDARRASAIAVLSAQQVEMVRRSYRRDALLAPVGPPEHFFEPPERAAARARLGIADDVFLVVGSGILVEHRRFEDLIEAIALLLRRSLDPRPDRGSDHVDPAYADRLAAQIAARGLGARVTLPRRSLSDAELKDTYAAADVFVDPQPALRVGARAARGDRLGDAVILTPGAGVYDILAGRAGVQAVPAQDPHATAEAIRRWRRARAARASSRRARGCATEYALDSYVQRMEQIYADVVGAGAPSESATLASGSPGPLERRERALRERAQENCAPAHASAPSSGGGRRVQQAREPRRDARDRPRSAYSTASPPTSGSEAWR